MSVNILSYLVLTSDYDISYTVYAQKQKFILFGLPVGGGILWECGGCGTAAIIPEMEAERLSGL